MTLTLILYSVCTSHTNNTLVQSKICNAKQILWIKKYLLIWHTALTDSVCTYSDNDLKIQTA